MLRPLLALALLAIAAPAFAQGTSYETLAEARKTVSAPATVEHYGPDPLEKGELRLPEGDGPFPIAVVIHGGCWLSAMEDWSGTAPLADALTARGIATWNIEYRRIGDLGGGYPGTLQDIAAAVDYVRVLAKSYRGRLDARRVIVVGHSSGAHLALWAASRRKLDKRLAGKRPLKLRSVVAIDGPGALAPFVGPDTQVCGQPVIVPFMGGTPAEKPAEYALASPADHLPLGTAQLFVLGALGDFMQPYVAAAREGGDPVTVLTPGGADHFNIITPSLPQGKDVVEFIAGHAF